MPAHAGLWLCVAACGRLGFDPGSSPGSGPPSPGVDAPGSEPTTVGLIAYWPMDSVAAGTPDMTGTNGATCAAGQCPTTTAGVLGSAAMFDGTSSCLQVPALMTWAAPTFTISAWIQSPAMSGPLVVHESDTGCPSPLMEVTNGAGLVQYNKSGTHSTAWTVSAIGAVSAWHQIAVVWDGTTQSIYLDGICSCTAAPAAQPWLNPQMFSIGCYPGAATLFTGAIDEVRVYERPLEPVEIGGLYAISGRTAPTPVACSAACGTAPP